MINRATIETTMTKSNETRRMVRYTSVTDDKIGDIYINKNALPLDRDRSYPPSIKVTVEVP
jgi:hypothetical protein